MPRTTQSASPTEALDHLIQTNRDSEEGYWTAAEGVKDPLLRTLFHRYAQQRARFAAELEHKVRTYGANAVASVPPAGTAGRGWVNLKAAVTDGNVAAILAECHQTEQLALEQYEEYLRDDLPEQLKQTLREQHHEVRESRHYLRTLEESQAHS